MAQNQRITIFCIVVLALLLFMINSAELKPHKGPGIRKLVEIKTVDENGVVKARVVAKYEPTDTEEQRTWSESAGGAKRYPDDDEDSKGTSSGDSETYGESYDMVANDDPMAMNRSSEGSGSPSQSSSRSINSTSKPINSNSSTVLPTTGQVNGTSSPITVSTTTKMNTTTAGPPTTNQVTTAGTETTVTTGKQNVTTTQSTLILPSMKETETNRTTISSTKVTEVETTAPAATTTSVPTTTAMTKPTEITRAKFNVTETTPLNASTTASTKTTRHRITVINKSTSTSPDIKGLKGPAEKAPRRKTLFGFVTVEILIALLAGALFSILLVAFLVYRLKKRNEGSYELSETIALRPKEIDEMGKKKEVFV